MGHWRASRELAAQCPTRPCAYPGTLKRIAGGKTTVPMLVACTLRTLLPAAHTAAKTSLPHPRGLRTIWRGEFWMCAPPGQVADP